MPLPPWMADCPAADVWNTPLFTGEAVRRPRRRLVNRALAGITSLMAGMVTDRQMAERPGILQRIDARAKVIGLIGLLVVTTLVHRPATLAAAAAGCLVLALAARLPARRLAQAWLAVPLFSAAIVLPAVLNIVTPGPPLWVLARPEPGAIGPFTLPDTIAVTAPGVLVAGRFVLRTLICVTLALVLTATTRPDRLFRGLRALGVPRLFVMVLSMMERYLMVLLRVAEEIHLARRSRSVVPGTLGEDRRWVGAGVGSVFRRTQSLGGAVYLAMLSRGFTGEVRLLDDAPLRARDYIFVVLAAVAAAAMLIWR